MRACLEVYLGTSWKFPWNCTVKQAGSKPSSTIKSNLPTVLDCHFWTGSGPELNCYQVGRPGCQFTQTINWGTVQCKSPNSSELSGLSEGRPVSPSVDSYNVLLLQFDDIILLKSCIQPPIISFCIIGSVQYQLFWNLCCSFHMSYYCLEWWSIVLLWAHISVQCHDY